MHTETMEFTIFPLASGYPKMIIFGRTYSMSYAGFLPPAVFDAASADQLNTLSALEQSGVLEGTTTRASTPTPQDLAPLKKDAWRLTRDFCWFLSLNLNTMIRSSKEQLNIASPAGDNSGQRDKKTGPTGT